MSTLLLRLTGPMQSWGTKSRFDIRDTEQAPSKSGVIGLLCAALGQPRDESRQDLPKIAELAKVLRMGVRVDREGIMSRDYHTAGGGSVRGVKKYGVAKASGASPDTVESHRYFLADADFLVGLESNDHGLLERLHTAVANPVWPLYLGRKSFVPGRPVYLLDGLKNAPLKEALAQYPWRWRRTPGELHPPDQIRLVLETDYGKGEEVHHDQPICFEIASRKHGIRHVTTKWIETKDLQVEEAT